MSQLICPAGCGPAATPSFDLGRFEVSRCAVCGVYQLHQKPGAEGEAKYDREQFLDAFRALRVRNYRRTMDEVAAYIPLRGARVLDVGSSIGWFLEEAATRGCRCFGIEPDPYFCQRARASLPAGVELAEGHFPEDLPAGWAPFDVITFHDVFEHLDDPCSVLQACRERLNEEGVTLLSLPSAHGFVYRIGCWLYRLGWKLPLERMFQVNYPYPHLYYFTPKSLQRLAEEAGFEVVRVGRLDGFSMRGALARARMDEGASAAETVTRYATAVALAVFGLLQKVLPPDNVYVLLRLRER